MLKVILHKSFHLNNQVAQEDNVHHISSHQELIEISEKARGSEHHISIITERRDVFFAPQDKSFTIKVDPKSVMEATLLVLMDKRVPTESLFIHGSSVKDDTIDTQILSLASSLLKNRDTENLVINSLQSKECDEKQLAYPGGDIWKEKLNSLGVFNIHEIVPSLHTAAESENIIDICLQKGWGSITIITSPHHLLRCMCQTVYFLHKKNATHLKVYARTLDNVNWSQAASKTVLGTGKTIEGTLYNHIEAEFQRIEKYMDPTGKGYTPHATLEEVIAYIQQRDNL